MDWRGVKEVIITRIEVQGMMARAGEIVFWLATRTGWICSWRIAVRC